MVDVKFGLIFLFSCFCAAVAASDGIPAFIWTSDELHTFPTTLTGHTTTQNDFRQKYLDKLVDKPEHNLVVFLQDKLSLDDITQHADVFSEGSDGATFHNLKSLIASHSAAELASVDSPVTSISELKKEYSGKIHQLASPYSISSLPLGDSASNLVIVDLPETTGDVHKALKQIDGILGSVTSQLKESGKPYTAIYTSQRPSKVYHENQHLGRHLLASNETTYTFLMVGDCLMFYVDPIVFEVTAIDNKTNNPPSKWTLPPLTEAATGSKCTAGNGSTSARLNLNYANVDGLENVEMMIDFGKAKARGYWGITSFTINYKGKTNSTNFDVKNATMAAAKMVSSPNGFSYHCTNTPPLQQASDTGTRARITFARLQVEMGNFTKKSQKFGRANDCIGFMTIPILSGLFTMLLLGMILAYGFYMITDITTMDRFDDPKGKTITVNVSE